MTSSHGLVPDPAPAFRAPPEAAAGGVVYKEAFGADGPELLRHEKSILQRLAAIEGVPRLAAGAHPGNVLALEQCAGTPLVQLLRTDPVALDSLPLLAERLATLLAAVHRAGVVHGHISPATIVLSTPQGQPVLIDFELAVFADQHPGFAPPSEIVGTLAYLAPEQTGRTGRAVDQRADLYALGATLYELATGGPPFQAEDPLELIHDQLVREPIAPVERDPRLPRGLSDIILRLLAKEPDRRYQSAEGLAHDLARLRARLAGGDRSAFPLGDRDFAVRLAPPSRLVGRKDEIAALQQALENALRGGSRGVLVSGPPGVGKSALINELRPMVAARRGWFLFGKFDAQRQDLASDGMFQALRALGRMLLAEPEAEMQAIRARIVGALGATGCGLVATVPELALLLGAAPGAEGIDPLIETDRLVEVTLDLLRVVASPERPLVIVVDDVQWAAPLPIGVINAVLTDTSLRGVLLVCAYRPGEPGALHLLAPMLARWSLLDPPPLALALHNLPPGDLAALLAEMLRLPQIDAARLGQAVSAQTGGNPFDTVQLLDGLRRDGTLVLGADGWSWDSRAIRGHLGQGSVAGLMAARIGALPLEARDLLQAVACLGGEVELELLQAACGVPLAELEQRLGPALEEGLLLQQRDGQRRVHFRHDRVQQACLGGLPPAERRQLHLALARRLAASPGWAAAAAHQYLPALDAIDDPGERLRVAELLRSGASRVRAFNPATAERFLSGALTLLARAGTPDEALLPLDVERHLALYQLGQLEEAETLYRTIESLCADPLLLAGPACVQISSLTNRGRPGEAIALGQVLLRRLGMPLLETGALVAQLERGPELFSHWQDTSAETADLQRAEAGHPHALAAGRLINRMMAPSFFCDPLVLVGLVLASQHLWVTHGPAAELAGPLSHAPFVSIGVWQDYPAGHAIGRRVLRICEARGYEPGASQSRFLFALGSSPWCEPLERSAAEAQRAHDGLMQGGDLQNACFAHYALLYALMDCAPTLEQFAAETDAALALSARTGNDHAALSYLPHRQLARMLRGETAGFGAFDDASFDEAAHLAGLGANPMAAANFTVSRAMAAALAGDSDALIRNAAAALSLKGAVGGTYLTVAMHLLQALALAQQLRGTTLEARSACLAELDACHGWLAARAQDMPGNYLYLVRWIDAERAWALGDFPAAAAAFDDAGRQADPKVRPWHKGLIAERAGLFLIEHGLHHSGEKYLAKAKKRYARWGASAKVRQLEQAHACLRQAAMPARGAEAAVQKRAPGYGIDMLALLRALQALSSETHLDSLKTRVVELLVSMTGATSVLLALWNAEQKQWSLSAGSGSQDRPLQIDVAAARGLLPLSAFRYAERTLEPLLVEDATRDERFGRDPYIAALERCSLLLVPILGQGAPRAMLLLENRLSRGAFSADRLDPIMLIAGQLAVSLENAQLYEELEQRVVQRTSELQAAQAELLGTARRAGMAEIASNVLHNVGNILNSVNVSTNLIGSKVRGSRAHGLSLAVALMEDNAADLGRFLTVDEKGKRLPGYLSTLAKTLEAERADMLEELGHLSRSIDHIKDVVATQQSYAGTSSLYQPARICDLVEDALRINGDALTRQVTVVKEFEPVPEALLDRTRVMQILVNLISNARHAMHAAGASALLTLQVQASGGLLRICVRDEGEGVPTENLTRIFAHGFTTRKGGHGFGLHSCALAAQQMGGTLTAASEGTGRGATFTLELPIEFTGAA